MTVQPGWLRHHRQIRVQRRVGFADVPLPDAKRLVALLTEVGASFEHTWEVGVEDGQRRIYYLEDELTKAFIQSFMEGWIT